MMSGPVMAPPRDSGFTLLEGLVAFVIAALALVALFQGAAAGLGNAARANETENAVALARSHLAAFDALPAPAAMELQDDEGRFHWAMQVTPLASVPVSAPAHRGRAGRQEATALYAVSVTVSWTSSGHPASVQLHTQRLTPVPPPA